MSLNFRRWEAAAITIDIMVLLAKVVEETKTDDEKVADQKRHDARLLSRKIKHFVLPLAPCRLYLAKLNSLSLSSTIDSREVKLLSSLK